MEPQLTPNEIDQKRELLKDYSPAQNAIATLQKNDGRLDITLDELWVERNPTPTYAKDKSLWKTTLDVLSRELCGDEGFRSQFKEYTKNPGSAPLLTGLIVSLTTLSGLPIDPAIATVVVLYILKVGLNVFCEYTQPEEAGTEESP